MITKVKFQSDDDTEVRFHNRKVHLDRYCAAWTKEGHALHQFKTLKTGIAYPKAELLLCAPWKCGSSYWRQFVVKLHARHDENWSDRRERGNDPVTGQKQKVLVFLLQFLQNRKKSINLQVKLTDTIY